MRLCGVVLICSRVDVAIVYPVTCLKDLFAKTSSEEEV